MKWFITDMDGTFLNDKKEVAPNAKDVIVKLQDKGSKFIIATGRPDIAVKHYYYNLGMNDVVISNNGSLIRNLSTGEVVYQKSFKIEEIEKIQDSAQAEAEFNKTVAPLLQKENEEINKIAQPMMQAIHNAVESIRVEKQMDVVLDDPYTIRAADANSKIENITNEVISRLKK